MRMPGVLALDLATKSGWAWASPVAFRDWPLSSLPIEQRVGPVDEVDFGTMDLKPQKGGEFFESLSDWIDHLVADYRPSAIVVEAPAIYGKHPNLKGVKAGGIAELVAWRHKLPCLTASPAQWKKGFVGKGNAKKPEIMAECIRRGWMVEDDNAADALGLLDYCINWMHEGDAWAA